jgi:acetyl esterase/lipase
MKTGGVDVELSVWEGMWHGFHVIPNTTLPEAQAGFREVADFFARKLKLQQLPSKGRDHDASGRD